MYQYRIFNENESDCISVMLTGRTWEENKNFFNYLNNSDSNF